MLYNVYVAIAHTNDDDADYYVFRSLESAVGYLRANDLVNTEWRMSTIPELPVDDYTDYYMATGESKHFPE